MTIKVGEIGKIFRLAASFDMSASTALTIKLTDPDGVETTITNPRVTAPASTITDPDLGPLTASTYMQFTTLATDFTVAGTWTACGVYVDATPKKFHSDQATFTIGEAC